MLPGFNRSDQETASIGMPEATDTGRRVHNAIRYAVVHEVDYEAGEIRTSVQDGELITDWIPWATLRAGPDLSWWAPEIGEVVLLLAPSGELSNAVALPAAFSNGVQPAVRETIRRDTFLDGAVIEYDRLNHRYLIDLAGARNDGRGPRERDRDSEGEDYVGPEQEPPTVVILTRENRLVMKDEVNGERPFIRIESTGDIELRAAGNVIIQSGYPVTPNDPPDEVPDDIVLEFPPAASAGTFIQLNP